MARMTSKHRNFTPYRKPDIAGHCRTNVHFVPGHLAGQMPPSLEGACPVSQACPDFPDIAVEFCPGLEAVATMLKHVASKIEGIPPSPEDNPEVYSERRNRIAASLRRLATVARAPAYELSDTRTPMPLMRLALAGNPTLINFVERLPKDKREKLDFFRAMRGWEATRRAVEILAGYS